MSDINKKITKKDLWKVNLRWLFAGESGWNYERMQGLGYCYSMMPVLKKLYPEKEDMKKALKLHLQFFNTHYDAALLIFGADIAVEENKGLEAKETVTAIKTGLMGPLAGIGDTLHWVIAGTVFGSIAAYMALNGSSLGIWIWLAFNIARLAFRWEFMKLGYSQGTKLSTVMGDKLKSITQAASVLGLTVIGALVPAVVRANVPFVFKSGEVTMELQSMLDQIMPSLIPVGIVALVYWILGRKKMTSNKTILLLMILSIVLYKFNILG